MASITKRGKTWQYAISNYVDGKSRPIRKGGFKTKKEAQVAAAEMELQLKNGVPFEIDKIPFNMYFDRWVDMYKKGKVSHITLGHYSYTLDLITEYFKDKFITDISRNEYQGFLNHIGSTRSKGTVAKVNVHIKACISDALEEKIIQSDFTRKTVLAWKNSAKKKDEKYLNYQDYKTLLNAVIGRLNRSDAYYIILLALVTGMRFSEIIGLTTHDFDFIHNKISITKTWSYQPSSPFGFGPLKNDASERTIQIDGTTMKYMKEYIDNMTSNEYDLLFYNTDSIKKCIGNSICNKLLKSLSDKLGIQHVGMHGLRHTHASSLLYQKASIYYVSERLGHKDINTTLREYTHVMKELRQQDERLAISTIENMYDVQSLCKVF